MYSIMVQCFNYTHTVKILNYNKFVTTITLKKSWIAAIYFEKTCRLKFENLPMLNYSKIICVVNLGVILKNIKAFHCMFKNIL